MGDVPIEQRLQPGQTMVDEYKVETLASASGRWQCKVMRYWYCTNPTEIGAATVKYGTRAECESLAASLNAARLPERIPAC